MQENRSFDHLLGYLSHPRHGLPGRRRAGLDIPNGLTGDESNPLRPGSPGVRVAAYPDAVELFDRQIPAAAVPYSPHHEHAHVVRQIDKGTMGGFALDLAERYPNIDPQLTMSFYTGAQLPVLRRPRHPVRDLRPAGSARTPGRPSRTASAPSAGTPRCSTTSRSDDPIYAYLRMPTIFDVLTEAGVDWVYYEGDVGFLRMYDRYRLDARHVVGFDDPQHGFRRRAELGLLPPVTFIDPNFADIPPAATANDDHAPADLRLGQRLVERHLRNAANVARVDHR